MRPAVGGKPIERGGTSTGQINRFETELLQLHALAHNRENLLRIWALHDVMQH